VPVNFDNRNAWKVSDSLADQHRRSAYIFVRRNTPYPLLDTFDWANPQLVHGRREVTTTAPQALALVNSDLVFEWSKALAGRVIREAGENDSARLDRLYQIAFGRTPDKSEKESLLAFLDKQEKVVAGQLAGGKKVVHRSVPRTPAPSAKRSTASSRPSTAAALTSSSGPPCCPTWTPSRPSGKGFR
jgi:hypothetical protein